MDISSDNFWKHLGNFYNPASGHTDCNVRTFYAENALTSYSVSAGSYFRSGLLLTTSSQCFLCCKDCFEARWLARSISCARGRRLCLKVIAPMYTIKHRAVHNQRNSIHYISPLPLLLSVFYTNDKQHFIYLI